MDEEKLNDFKIKQYLKKDKIISKRVNETFDNFITELRRDESDEVPEIPIIENISKIENASNVEKVQNSQNVQKYEQKVQEFPKKNNSFRKFATMVASLVIVVFTSNAYATSKGYDNIFFMIKEKYVEATNQKVEFSDRDITISYKPIYVTDSVQLQINRLQAENNVAKLYLNVKEINTNDLTPLKYVVRDEDGELLYENKSSKEGSEKEYSDVLELKNFSDEVEILNLDIYDKNEILIKNIKIDLYKSTIEAKSQNEEIKKLSQIKLNDFFSAKWNFEKGDLEK